MKKDIAKLEAELERLKKLVYFDELTDVLNRRGFNEEASKAFRAVSFGRKTIERRIGFRIPFSLLFLDLDDFKKINDKYGHEAGDKVLTTVAKLIKNSLRSNDIVTRWGGEEFVAALVGCDSEAAVKVAEKLRVDIEEKEIDYKGNKICLTSSIGVISLGNEKNLVELVDRADQAMYEAKKKGKNSVVCIK